MLCAPGAFVFVRRDGVTLRSGPSSIPSDDLLEEESIKPHLLCPGGHVKPETLHFRSRVGAGYTTFLMASVTALLAWGGVPWDELAIAFRVVVLVVMVWPGAAGGPCSTELRLFPEELIADDEPAEAIAYGNIAAVESVPSTRVFFFFRYRRIRISLRDRSSFVEIEIGASKASQLIAELAVRAYASGVRGIGAIHRPRRFYINDVASIAGVTIASFAMVPGARLLVVSGLAAFFVVWTARQWLGIHRAAQRLASGIVPVSVGEWAAALDALAQREQLARSLTVPPHRSSEDPRGLTEERAIADVRTWWETRRVNGGGWRSPELAPSKSILEPVRSSTGVYRTSSVAADNERAATVRDVVHRRAKLTARCYACRWGDACCSAGAL